MDEATRIEHANRAREEGGLPSDVLSDMRERIDRSEGTVPLADPRIAHIPRLRLFGWEREFPAWDVSYCYGQLADGRLVRVDIGTHQLQCPRHRHQWKAKLVEVFAAAGRNAKDMTSDWSNVSLLPG